MFKMGKKVAVMLFALALSFNLTMQFASAKQIPYFPAKYQGNYRHPTESWYLIGLTGETSAVFEGKVYRYGLSAASDASLVAIDPDKAYPENFSILFGKRANYDPITESFEPALGELLLVGEYYPEEKAIEINETRDTHVKYTKR